MNYQLVDYLKANYSNIDPNYNIREDLSLMDSDLENNNVFLIGENHGVKANVILRMKFLCYFKEKTNFKYYIYELPHSVAYFLNKYLDSGDENILKEAYRFFNGTYAWNSDEYNHWKDLYKYNKTLSKEDKLIILGIDIEHQPKNAFIYMRDCLTKNNLGGQLSDYISKYIDKENGTNEELKQVYEWINEELVKNEDYYKKQLEEDYFNIVHVNNNLWNKLEVYTSNNFNGTRSIRMYENFLSISKGLPEGKFFGQLGLSHVFQRAFPYMYWFAAQLQNGDSGFKERVLSIVYAYDNCRYLYPTDRRNYESDINTWDDSIEEYKYINRDAYTILKLNNEDSPFMEDLLWPLKHKFPTSGVTTDYFQYLLLIKNSKAMEAF